jgi:hypothetical protein
MSKETEALALSQVTTVAVIPAQPGYELLTFSQDHDSEFWFDRQPIIAWRIAGSGWPWPEPITVSGDKDCGPNTVILCPDGKVEWQSTATFDSLEKWKVSAEAEWRRSRESKGA